MWQVSLFFLIFSDFLLLIPWFYLALTGVFFFWITFLVFLGKLKGLIFCYFIYKIKLMMLIIFNLFSLLSCLFRGGNPECNKRKGDGRLPKVFRLINCPFAASAYFQKKKNHWSFSVSNPALNHPSAHTANRQLTESLFEEMKNLAMLVWNPQSF